MTTIQELRRKVREAIPAIYEESGIKALTGDGSGVLQVTDASGNVIPGKIWVRRMDTRETVAVWGGASGAGATVKLHYDEAGELYIARNVWRDTAATHPGAVHSITSPPQNGSVAIVEVPDFRFQPGRVTRSRQAGLFVSVSEVSHRGGWFGGQDIELTPTVTASRHSVQVVSIDTVNNELAVTVGDDMLLTQLRTPEEIKAAAALIATPPHYSRRGAVRLANGQTTLTDADIVDIRQHGDNALLDIDNLPAESTVDGALDYVPMYDSSAGAMVKVLIDDLPAGSGTGDIEGVTAGSGLSGGGTSGTVTLDVDINGLASDATPDVEADYVMTYDADADALKKVLLSNLPTAGSGNRAVLYDDTLAADGSWDVSSLSQDYTHLQIIALVRSNVASTVDQLYLLFNNDATAANYRHVGHFASNSQQNFVAGDTPLISQCPAASSPSGYYVLLEIMIPFYTAGHEKISRAIGNERRSSTDIVNWNTAHHWESTAAINRIMLRTDNHSTDLIAAGSRLQIVGFN